MHMDIIPMHISHIIMVTLRFMSAFLLLWFSLSGWWHNTPVTRRCQPLFRLSAFFTKNIQDWYVISCILVI